MQLIASRMELTLLEALAGVRILAVLFGGVWSTSRSGCFITDGSIVLFGFISDYTELHTNIPLSQPFTD
jgi:hypothetical protein